MSDELAHVWLARVRHLQQVEKLSFQAAVALANKELLTDPPPPRHIRVRITRRPRESGPVPPQRRDLE
jgi:hypothetical protein